MDMESWMPGEPRFDSRGLMRCEVVDNDVYLQAVTTRR
jgi:hypothetical protein